MRRTLLVMLLLTLAVPAIAAHAATPGTSTAAPAAAPATAPDTDAAPAATPDPPADGQADGVTKGNDSGEAVPFLDLETPKPQAVCLTGWCSNDFQCVQWYGRGWTCYKQQGQSCGQCQNIAQ